ncbi:MAG TPA: glycosyl hydrolase family 18 protein [Ohtaekwangia sp.]
MKRLLYISMIAIAGCFAAGCDDEASNPVFSDEDVPRIFGWSTVNKYFIDIKDSLILSMKVSPENGASFKWTIDGEAVEDSKVLRYKFDEIRSYEVKFEVNRNGVINSRTAEVIVTKPFEPKAYAKKVVGFMTRNGSLETINLKNITHLVISSAVVAENGESLVDTTFASLDIPLIVKAAHNEGVYVLLDVTGQIDLATGGGLYGSYTFYNVIKDEEKRDKAIATFLKFAKDNDMDGVNIYLNNATEDQGILKPEFTLPFFEAVGEALPDGPNGKFIYTVTASGGWLTSEFRPIVDVEAIDWVHLQPFRYGDPSITADAPFWGFTDLAATWIGFGLPKEKIVNGIPAYGLHYKYPDDGTTVGWGNMWMYTSYDSYKSLFTLDPDAHTKNKLEVDDGIFYDGHPGVQQKAQHVVTAELGGVMVWGIENDTQDQSKSMLKAINTALGNP